MNRSLKIILALVVAAGLIGVATYAFVTAPTKAPTQTAENSTVPLAPRETPPTETPSTPEPTSETAYRISSEKSKASFSLGEDLRGERVTVVGVTSDISGEVEADRADLSDARIGTIRINARTFVTDSEQRNNAIRRMILKTEDDANEFIEFTTKTITGLPAKADIGQSFTFEATGDLKVSGVTKEVTFKGTGTFTSEMELSGMAEAKIHYPDWNISVPNLPFLANVEQDTTLKIEFVATK